MIYVYLYISRSARTDCENRLLLKSQSFRNKVVSLRLADSFSWIIMFWVWDRKDTFDMTLADCCWWPLFVPIISQNQTQVATSLQVFHNLGVLAAVVERVVSSCYDTLHRSVRSCLDVTALSQQQSFATAKGGGVSTGGEGGGRIVLFFTAIWASIRERAVNKVDDVIACEVAYTGL